MFVVANADNNTKEDLEELLEEDSDEVESGKETEASLRTLGEDDSDCTPGVWQKTSEKTETVVNRDGYKQPPQVVKKTYASLFVGNS